MDKVKLWDSIKINVNINLIVPSNRVTGLYDLTVQYISIKLSKCSSLVFILELRL